MAHRWEEVRRDLCAVFLATSALEVYDETFLAELEAGGHGLEAVTPSTVEATEDLLPDRGRPGAMGSRRVASEAVLAADGGTEGPYAPEPGAKRELKLRDGR